MRYGIGGVVAASVGAGLLALGSVLAYAVWRLERGPSGDAGGLAALQVDLVVLGVAVAGLLGLLSFHAYHLVFGPIRDLTARLLRIGRGSFRERAPVVTPLAESQALAAAVNEMAASLQWREQRLLHTERLTTIGTLLAGVAHEVNNPLTFLRLNGETLLGTTRAWAGRANLPEPVRAEAGRAAAVASRNLEGLDRLGNIVAALRDISRPAGKDLRPHDVNRVVAGCLLVAQPRASARIRVHRDLAATQRALTDAGELSQVVLNLLLNAYDALEGEGEVRLFTADREGHVEIRVADDGPGISPALLPVLFQPFVTTKAQGTGLGLALSRTIVERHGGTLAYETSPAGGACFVVTLPAEG